MALPSGMTLAKISENIGPAGARVIFSGTGTYTAADFPVSVAEGLGFTPNYARFINLTDRVTMEQFVDAALDGGSNAKGLKQVAAGTGTYEATGLAITAKTVTLDVDVCLLTNADDFVLICER
jgi:hypothetical protein